MHVHVPMPMQFAALEEKYDVPLDFNTELVKFERSAQKVGGLLARRAGAGSLAATPMGPSSVALGSRAATVGVRPSSHPDGAPLASSAPLAS